MTQPDATPTSHGQHDHEHAHGPHDEHSHDHTNHDHPKVALTRNQTLVLDALTAAEGPLTAYTLLDRLRGDGLRAPLQIYRALDKLIDLGKAHRLESINAFVPCTHPGCHGHAGSAFMICDVCGRADEISEPGLTGFLAAIANRAGFALQRSAVELRGRCPACLAAAPAAS